MSRPTVLFYCQHSVGLGHLVRSLALADGLASTFDVVVLNGGRLPAGTTVPDGVAMVNLPPLGHDDGYELKSHDPAYSVAEAQQARVDIILDALHRHDPAAVIVELYPFGRKKFAFELEPLLDAVAARGPARPKVICSLRDILVNQRRDQARHDERACLAANRRLDAILVHSDPRFARLEESFRPSTPLRVPVHYTGFVAPPSLASMAPATRTRRVVASVGGGLVGAPLVRTAVAAHRAVFSCAGLTTLVVAGPFLPDDDWEWLQAQADESEFLEIRRSVPDLAAVISTSAVSVSQAGYNTTMDLLRARTPAIVVPYAEGKEDEQTRRAERLDEMGLVRHLPSRELTPEALAAAIVDVAGTTPNDMTLDLDGRAASARIIADLVGLGSEPLSGVAT